MMALTSDSGRERTFWVSLFLVTVVAAVLRLAFVGSTPLTSDDYGVVTSAFDFTRSGHYGTTMWQHPKLRDLLTYASVTTLGSGAWGVAGASLICGIATVPLIGLLARRLFSSAAIGLLAAFLLAVDPVHIDFSRQAIQEVHMPLFTLGAMLAALSYVEKKSLYLPPLAGVLFGLGIAGKWYVVFPLGVTLAALGFITVRDSKLSPREKGCELLYLAVSLAAVPATTYAMTYLPWFACSGHNLADWVAAQRFMAKENLVHQGFNAYLMELSSHPILWFLIPAYWVDFNIVDHHPTVWAAISNPTVWLLTLPACGALLYRGIRGKRYSYLYFSACFWCSYLPLALARRPIWLNTSFAVTPFAFMAVAWGVVTFLRHKQYRRLYLLLYAGVVLTVTAPLYVLAIGKGYDNPLFNPIMERFRPSNEKQ